MADYPYTIVPNRLKSFLERIPDEGVPPKLTTLELMGRGFKSSNDRSILRVLRAIGLLDESGVPTQAWQRFRNRDENRALMAELMREGYADLFHTYPDACRRTDDELRNFMATRTSLKGATVGYMVSTFKTLCELADFDSMVTPAEPSIRSAGGSDVPSAGATHPEFGLRATVPRSVTLSLSINVSDSTQPEMIEAIFRNAAKYLFGEDVG